MTGYGRAEGEVGGKKIFVEVRSTNGRFLDVRARLPQRYDPFEQKLKEHVQKSFTRGSIEVVVQFREDAASNPLPQVDRKRAKSLARSLKILQKELGLTGEVDLRLLLSFKEWLGPSVSATDREWRSFQKILSLSLKRLKTMRAREGSHLKKSIENRLKQFQAALSSTAKRVPVVLEQYRQKLASRVQELLKGNSVDPERLEQEVVFMAQRSDVTEEIDRLQSHIVQFKNSLRLSGPVGRKLEFLLQEMNREVNTLGSKASDATIAQTVVEMKSALEKMREQVANVE